MANHGRMGIFRRRPLLATIITGATIATGAAVPRSAAAYEPTETLDGLRVRWFARAEPIPFHTALVPRHAHIPVVDFPALVQAAYDQWSERAPCSTVPVFVHGGTTNATAPTAPEDPSQVDNLVVFITSADEWQALRNSSTVLATTYARYFASTGELFEADIAINAAIHEFSVDPAGPDGTRDLVTVLQHETGHALGLAHSRVATAAMHAGYPDPTSDEPLPGRRLAADDLDGICASYSDVPAHVPPDVTPPALHHDPVTTVAQGHAAPIEADVTDESGVAFVYLHYRADGDADFTQVELAADPIGVAWRGEIPSTATEGASVAYYLVAVDGSRQSNAAQDPPTAPDTVHRITVVSENEPADAIETSPPDAEPSEALETSPQGGGDVVTTADASAAETFQGGDESGCAGGGASGVGKVVLVLVLLGACWLGGRSRARRSLGGATRM